MKIEFMQHSIDRFVQRICPGMGAEEAKELLEANASRASPMKEKTVNGTSQWLLDDPRCILVIKRDVHSHTVVCVTVLEAPPLEETEHESEEEEW